MSACEMKRVHLPFGYKPFLSSLILLTDEASNLGPNNNTLDFNWIQVMSSTPITHLFLNIY
jgi:hypothetical protein